ncbi:hypothetical protein [Chitinophaga sp. RAB17]|uniref:FEKKY domain-containing protein n=1 Tax=Chitinophaga sp. RAB17 TaxID=3233049 RepID=UPI003F92FF01
MKTLLVIILLSAVSNNALAQSKQKEKIRLLTYGLPYFERIPFEEQVAAKWGIELYAIGGCVIEQQLMDSAKRVNEVAEKKIIGRYGKNWRERFNKEIDALFATPERAADLVNSQDYIRQQEQGLRASGDSLHYTWSTTRKKGVYHVLVSGSVKNTIFYKLLVDYPQSKVSILSRR